MTAVRTLQDISTHLLLSAGSLRMADQPAAAEMLEKDSNRILAINFLLVSVEFAAGMFNDQTVVALLQRDLPEPGVEARVEPQATL